MPPGVERALPHLGEPVEQLPNHVRETSLLRLHCDERESHLRNRVPGGPEGVTIRWHMGVTWEMLASLLLGFEPDDGSYERIPRNNTIKHAYDAMIALIRRTDVPSR